MSDIASRDQNRNVTIQGISTADLTSPTNIAANPTTKALIVEGSGGYITGTPYALRLDETSTANVTYVGKAVTGSVTSASVWQIFKLDETSNLSITWANGSAAFTNEWDNRLIISYS